MKRKEFLSSVVPLAVISSAKRGKLPEDTDPVKAPLYLKTGDVIGITCPSGAITSEEVQPAVNKMKEWGFDIRIGETVGLKDFTFAGTDEQRTKDFQQMLDDDSIDAIMLGRGGYGAVRIIDSIDFTKFRKKPKWIIGFSDATVFHSHINSNFKIATIHSKMCNSFPDDWATATPDQIDSINSIQKCLTGEKMEYGVPPHPNNRNGNARGILVGGNLSILQNLAGTKSEIDTAGKILFIEDTEEYLYNIDRMLWNLKRSNRLSKLRGLIVGGFTNIKPDDPGEEFGRTVYEMVMEKVKEYDYPVCFDFPVGHQKENYALKCGVMHRLNVDASGVLLQSY
ncbi:MAG TPA: LD-carboxypeptidase [Chitinophagaceae bacterium]|nr:LD-carboxypeptidase [Chitinophagaceae bacterium]